MFPILPVEAVRRVEEYADSRGLSYAEMMQRAGRVAAERAKAILSKHMLGETPRVTVLVGGGNNGGDGLVTATLLARETDYSVRVYLFTPRADDDSVFNAARDAGLYMVFAEQDRDLRGLRTTVGSAHLVIDAVLGIGARLPLRSELSNRLREARAALQLPSDRVLHVDPTDPRTEVRQVRPYVLAIDCPSGIDCDTGAADDAVIPADETITFIAVKPGLVTFPAAQTVGKLLVSTLDVPKESPDLRGAKDALVNGGWVKSALPHRPADGNKGTFGKVLIVGGSTEYIGAPALSARAAYRAGCGMVSAAVPESAARLLAPQMQEVTWVPLPGDTDTLNAEHLPTILEAAQTRDVLVVGMGMGRSTQAHSLIAALLQSEHLPPLVFDADALYLLADIPEWWTHLPENSVITPHPGEFARLTGQSIAEVQANRLNAAKSYAQQWGIHVLLKGAHTIIASPDGKSRTLPFKTSALATAGSGDVLAGMIGSLIAQGMQSFDSAAAGGYLHGLSADAITAQRGSPRGITAGDLIEGLSLTFARLSV